MERKFKKTLIFVILLVLMAEVSISTGLLYSYYRHAFSERIKRENSKSVVFVRLLEAIVAFDIVSIAFLYLLMCLLIYSEQKNYIYGLVPFLVSFISRQLLSIVWLSDPAEMKFHYLTKKEIDNFKGTTNELPLLLQKWQDSYINEIMVLIIGTAITSGLTFMIWNPKSFITPSKETIENLEGSIELNK